MWEGYVTAVEEYIAAYEAVTAHLVIDRFHVAEQYRASFDTLRKQEMKRLKQELPEESYQQDCQRTLWLLRKNHRDLEEDERLRLRRLFRHTPRLQQAYTLREELTAIFNQSQSVHQARCWLRAWLKKIEQDKHSCFRSFSKTLTRHWEHITNYFADHVTSGFVEGLNTKIRTITRRCYGIRKVSTLFQRLWLDLNRSLFYTSKHSTGLSTT